VNIILLEEHELGHSLPRRDERTIHLLKVLHKKTGDVFDAGILGGMKGTGRIEKINFDGSVFVTVEEKEPPPDRLMMRVAAGFVRPVQIRRILRALSNIGVSAIDLIGTDLGEKSYRDTKLLHDGGAHAAVVEGSVQARDTTIPDISVYDCLDNWLDEQPWEKKKGANNTALYGMQRSGLMRVPLLIALDNVRPEGSLFHVSPTSRPAVLAVGPERGWSDRERGIFEKAGFLRLSMGNRALRTETACVAAAVLAMEKTGEL